MKQLKIAILTAAFGLLTALAVTAAPPPERINFQGRLVADCALVNTNATFVFRLDDAAGGRRPAGYPLSIVPQLVFPC